MPSNGQLYYIATCTCTYISIPEGEAGSDINIDNLGQEGMVLACGEAL